MKKPIVIIIPVVVLVIVGALIVGWSVYRSGVDMKPESFVKSFSDENFQKEVVEASNNQPILVDFYADWCVPCKMLEPVIEEVAKDLHGCAVVGKIDTDKNMISRRFGIKKIPAVFLIRDREVKKVFYGIVPKEKLIKALKEMGPC